MAAVKALLLPGLLSCLGPAAAYRENSEQGSVDFQALTTESHAEQRARQQQLFLDAIAGEHDSDQEAGELVAGVTEEDTLCSDVEGRASCAFIVLNSLPSYPIKGLSKYEQRNLWNLMRLRNKKVKLLFLTSEAIPEDIKRYHEGLVPGGDLEGRLVYWDAESLGVPDMKGGMHTPLATKINELPPDGFEAFTSMLQQFLSGTKKAFMKDFLHTKLEEGLIDRIGGLGLAPSPKLIACPTSASKLWGSKEGSRQAFEAAGVSYPKGTNRITKDTHVLSDEIFDMFDPAETRKVVVKHNDGASGMGNSEFKIKALPFAADWTACKKQGSGACKADIVFKIESALGEMEFPPGMPAQTFIDGIRDLGAIVEAWVDPSPARPGDDLTPYITSPSVQAFVYGTDVETEVGVDVLSTHEQILDGQVFLGAVTPARKAYNEQMVEMGRKVGQFLRSNGVMERFAIDTVVRPSQEAPDGPVTLTPYAIEINVRWGGTTAANEILRRLALEVHKDPKQATYFIDGQPIYYTSTDNCKSKRLGEMSVPDLLEEVKEFMHPVGGVVGKGIVMHMLGGMELEQPKFGFMAYGHSRSEAHDFYVRIMEKLGAAHGDEREQAVPDSD